MATSTPARQPSRRAFSQSQLALAQIDEICRREIYTPIRIGNSQLVSPLQNASFAGIEQSAIRVMRWLGAREKTATPATDSTAAKPKAAKQK